MTYLYDCVLRNGHVVDPVNGVNGRMDVGIKEGKLVDIEPELSPTLARDSFDLTGAWVLPGVIDLHVHASAWLGGKFAHRMMAEAGVTTALDMSGPIDSVLDIAATLRRRVEPGLYSICAPRSHRGRYRSRHRGAGGSSGGLPEKRCHRIQAFRGALPLDSRRHGAGHRRGCRPGRLSRFSRRHAGHPIEHQGAGRSGRADTRPRRSPGAHQQLLPRQSKSPHTGDRRCRICT